MVVRSGGAHGRGHARQAGPRTHLLGQQIGLEAIYEGANNPFPWMAEMIDLKKEKNFFETRVIEYQTGGALSWD